MPLLSVASRPEPQHLRQAVPGDRARAAAALLPRSECGRLAGLRSELLRVPAGVAHLQPHLIHRRDLQGNVPVACCTGQVLANPNISAENHFLRTLRPVGQLS